MGLDMYLTAKKRLNNKSKIERQYINYFNSLTDQTNIEEINSDGGLYISEYFTSKYIHDDIINMPKITGQVGEIRTVKRDGDSFIIETDAGYWRKANHIHNWFVENCQDGFDECQRINLTVAQLKSLNNTINAFGKLPPIRSINDDNWTPPSSLVLIAKQLLPTKAGFFYGSTAYDGLYFDKIVDTKQILKSILKPSTIKNWGLSYQSSW